MNYRLTAAVGACVMLNAGAAHAQMGAKLELSADVRLRAEQDWDSRSAAGMPRKDRARLRIRARANAVVGLGGGIKLHGRVRTGGTDSQQNANLTFHDLDGNPTDDFRVVVDRFSLQYQGKNAGAEVGRMAFPFFTQNEYFWDGDINPLGAAANLTLPFGGKTKLRLNAGAFKLPLGLWDYSGELYAAQALIISGPVSVAAGVFRFEADRSDPDRLRLLDNSGSRDYSVLALNAQLKVSAGGRPLTLGADLYHNAEGYAASGDPISRANYDQRTGYVLSAAWGDTSKPGNFQIGYRRFRMEKLAVNSSYAHDDVARFGTASQATLTDLAGHDLYANVAVTKGVTLGARAMFVERITNGENGKRVRFDLAYAF
jgi:hypothetical protein